MKGEKVMNKERESGRWTKYQKVRGEGRKEGRQADNDK